MAKIKQKTRKAVAKRFKKTKRGKLLHSSTGRGHLLSAKTRKRKRHLRAGNVISGMQAKKLAILIAD